MIHVEGIKHSWKSFRTKALVTIAGLYGILLATPEVIQDAANTLFSVDVVDYAIDIIRKWGALIAAVIGVKGAADSVKKPPLEERE